MKRVGFWAFVRKESLHILRDPRTMLIVLGIPVVQLLLFGFALSTEVNNLDFSVAAPHRSEAVRQLVERIAANDCFTFRGYVDPQQIDRELRRGRTDVVVVFADDFDRRMADGISAGGGEAGGCVDDGRAAVQLVFDASNPNMAAAGTGYLQRLLCAGNAPGAEVEMHLLYNPRMKSAYNFVPGIMGLLFILICSIMTSVSIVREKESGTMEVLLVSPVRPVGIVFAKMIPYFLLSCVDLAVILLLARYVLGVPLSGSVAGVVAISILYLLLALALGLFISTIADRQATALVISAMLMLLPVIMLSGMIFPVENMPGVLQALSCAIPARWYIETVRKLMIQALPFSAVVREFGILFAMTVALVAVALHKFNDKLE